MINGVNTESTQSLNDMMARNPPPIKRREFSSPNLADSADALFPNDIEQNDQATK